MEVVDTTQINSLPSYMMQVDFVPSSEEAAFILTASQLSALISQAIEKAIQPVQDEVSQLKAMVVNQGEKIAALEATQDQDASRLALDIAYDRQRLAKLEKTEPQPMQKDRGEILRALLAANGGKMLAKDARQKLRMDKGNFSRLLDTLKDYIDTKPLHNDKRKLLLIIKNRELVVHN